MKDCLFCKIINGDIPSMKVYEDDVCFAFLDINPDSDGHTLVIPKNHYKDFTEVKDDVLLHIFEVAKMIMKKYKEKLNATGYNLVTNTGNYQEIKHFHLKIIPYYDDKKFYEIVRDENSVSDPKEVYDKIKEA